ncbi:hypothetical protein GCM10026988_04260 [Vibrio panuliri]
MIDELLTLWKYAPHTYRYTVITLLILAIPLNIYSFFKLLKILKDIERLRGTK